MNKKILKILVCAIFLVGIVSLYFLINNPFIQTSTEINLSKQQSITLSAKSFNPEDNRDIGYEFLDNGEVHIWNTQDDYFFDVTSGIQLTNHYEDYWTRNIFCIGYYNNDEWHKIKCADELTNFEKSIETDGGTYVSAVLWKDFSYNDYNMRLGVQYYLGLDDKNLSITISGKNIGIDIPFDLGFAWKVTDIDVPIETTDRILINRTNYELDETYDLTFKNMTKIIKRFDIIGYENETSNGTQITIPIYNITETIVEIPSFKLFDYDEGIAGKENFLRVDWNANLDYTVKLYSDGSQESSYVALLINAGHFNPQQEKSTTFYWIDSLADNLVAYWTMDDASGNMTDAHGDLDGIPAGTPVYSQAGLIGTSIEFDGSSEYFAVPDNDAWDMPSDFTMSAWVLFDTFDAPNKAIIGRSDSATSGMYWAVESGANIRFRDRINGEAVDYSESWTPALATWYHVVITRIGSSFKHYINGTLLGSGITDTSDMYVRNQPLEIGLSTDNNYFWEGRLDEIGFWSRGFDQDDITALYNDGAGVAYPLVDIAPPYFIDDTPQDQTIAYGFAFNYTINATDAIEFGCFEINDTTNFNINCSGYLKNNTFLGVSLYNLNVSINDTSGNENSTLFWVNVTKAIDTFTTLLNGIESNLTVILPQQVNVTVSNNATTATIDVNGTIFDSGANYTLEKGVWFVNISTIGNQNYSANENHWYITVNNPEPHIQFETPTFIDLYNSTVYDFLANVSITETYFQNISFDLYNSTNELISSSTFIDTTRSFNYTATYDDIYNYSVRVSNTYDEINTTTRTINIDATVPSITLDVAQTTIAGLKLIPYNISINYTVIDAHLQRCWYNSTWNLTTTYLTCNQNLTNITLPVYGIDHTVFIYANDTFGNENVISKSISIDAIEIAQSYLNTTTEGTLSTFQINLTIPSSKVITIKDLFYNSTNNGAGTLTNIAENNYSIIKTIEIPNIVTKGNVTFYWNISLDDGTIFQSAETNQTVSAFSIDDCSVQGTLVLNYSLKDEETQSVISISPTLNSTVDIDVNIFTIDTSTLIINYSARYINDTNPQICIIDEVLNSTQYKMDVVTKYEATSYATEYYNIQSFTLTNNTIPQNINLFDLASADSTEFLITFKDETFALVEGALIDITRYYVDEGLFKTIEIPKTDSDGQTMGHFVQNDVIYTLIISKEGEILATFNDKVAICADATIGDCKMNLNSFSTGVPTTDFDTLYNLNVATTFDEDARRITTIFNTQDGSVTTVQLNATQFTGYGNTTVCSHLLTSSSGTLICDIPESFGNVTVVARLYSSSSPDRLVKIYWFSIEEDAMDIFGYTGIILVFILILTIPFLMISSTIGMIIGTFIGLIIAALLNFYEGGSLLGTGSTIIWAIIAGGIIIWKIAQRGET